MQHDPVRLADTRANSFSLNLNKGWGCLMARIQISNDPSGRIIVSFPYDPLLVTTEIYTHVSTKNLGKIRSPLDNFNLEGGDIDRI